MRLKLLFKGLSLNALSGLQSLMCLLSTLIAEISAN